MKVEFSDLVVIESGTFVSIEWKITNAIHTLPCVSFVSPTFSFTEGNSEWNLECWPNGKAVPGISNRNNITLSALGCVSIVVHCLVDRDILASCQLSLVTANKEHLHTKTVLERQKYGAHRIWEFDGFIDRRMLLDDRDNLLPDDVLTIFCKIGILPDDVSHMEKRQKELKSQLLNEIEQFVLNKEMSDVELVVDGSKFPAHKLILAARSPVFRAMFSHEMKESVENVVTITDLDKDVVEQLIRFMYTGSTNNFPEMAERLLIAADKYHIDSLKELCSLQMIENLSLENVCNTVSIASQYNLENVKAACLDFMSFRMDQVLETSGYRDMIVSYPDLTTEAFQYFVKKIKKNS